MAERKKDRPGVMLYFDSVRPALNRLDDIMQLDEVEVTAMLIMTRSMIDGDTDEEAAEKAANFLLSQGREAQAQAVLDTAKELQKGAQE